jgi:flagellin-like protein
MDMHELGERVENGSWAILKAIVLTAWVVVALGAGSLMSVSHSDYNRGVIATFVALTVPAVATMVFRRFTGWRPPWRRNTENDEGVSPVIAVILMVAITVVLASVVYINMSGFMGPQNAATGTMSVALQSHNETSWTYIVTSANNVQWENVNMITAPEPSDWEFGRNPNGTARAGDTFWLTVYNGPAPAQFTLTDASTNSVLLQVRL